MNILDTQFNFILVNYPSNLFPNGPLIEATVKHSDYAFLMFDMTRPETFEAVQKTYKRLNRLRESLKKSKANKGIWKLNYFILVSWGV
jgi:hypothetical protein